MKHYPQLATLFLLSISIAAITLITINIKKQQIYQQQAAEPNASITHIFIIMMENTDWADIKGNSSAPYINSLLPNFAHAEKYISPDHPSLPNYITLEAGDNLGMTNGAWLPGDHSITTTSHLTTLMKNAGISWKYYAENLPGNGTKCNLTDPGAPYSEDHNPFAYFEDVSGNPPNSSNQYCIQHERPFSELITDLQNNSMPQYSFIVPNDYDQGEKLAPGSNCKLCQADNFLKTNVPKIQNAPVYQNSAIFIVWDEGNFPTHNPSGLIIVSPFAKKNYFNTISYSHASTVGSVEEIFGLSPLLRNANNAKDLNDLFTIPLETTLSISPSLTQTFTNTPTPVANPSLTPPEETITPGTSIMPNPSDTPIPSEPTAPATSVTPIATDTPTPSPTPSPIPDTILSASLTLPGIGSVSQGNLHPLHPLRDIVVYVYNIVTGTVTTLHTTMIFDGNYFINANIDLGKLPQGLYQIFVKTNGYLTLRLINTDGTNTFPLDQGISLALPPNEMIPGDVAPYPYFPPSPTSGLTPQPTSSPNPTVFGDNVLDIRDYNAVIGCYLLSISHLSCQAVDLNDDGIINGIDYNILLKGFSEASNGDIVPGNR